MTHIFCSPFRSTPCLKDHDGNLYFVDGDRGYVPDVDELSSYRPTSHQEVALERSSR